MFDSPDPLLSLALVLLAGFAMGELARRARLPAVTGQILAGVLIGPAVLGWLGHGEVETLHPVTSFALGLIAVAVGSHLNFPRLRNAYRRLGWLILFEATITPLIVVLPAYISGDWRIAILLATLAVSTAPATVLALVQETRSKGVFVKTLMAAVALNNIVCIAFFGIAHLVIRGLSEGETSSTLLAILAPLEELALAAGLGVGVGVLLVLLTRRVARKDKLATASMVGILATVGVASGLGISSLLACTFLGIAISNLGEGEDLGHGAFSNFQGAIFAVFFTLAGTELDFDHLGVAGPLALAVCGARIVGKWLACGLAMRLSGATSAVRRYLGLALIPQAGVAVGLLLVAKGDPALEDIRDLLLATGITVVTLNELVGPVLTRLALTKSGEAGKDRSRLIDFIGEENIVTGFSPANKDEAIRELTSVMIRSNRLQDDPGRLLASVLAREKEASTCFGGNLAVPHGLLEEGESMVGAMGISKEGLDFETPDGEPVHCMVVLATPASQRDRHLEVLAALARAIGTDTNVKRRLFAAKSPAHAYEVLHAEEAETFNYFLED